MELREMKQRTAVYFRRKDVSPISWFVSGDSPKAKDADPAAPKLERVEHEGVAGYILPCEIREVRDGSIGKFPAKELVRYSKARLCQSDLPIEFFNHELQKADAYDEESVFEFVRTWGFPFLVDRNSTVPVGERRSIPSKADQQALAEKKVRYPAEGGRHSLPVVFEGLFGSSKRAKKAIEETESLIGALCGGVYKPSEQSCISVKEASLGIETLQMLTNSVLDSIRNEKEIPEEISMLINLGSSRTVLAGEGWAAGEGGTGLVERGYLTSAICNQILDTMADTNTPWRICAYEKCNRLFKRQRGKSRKPHADSIYCCSSHSENQKKNNQRKAAKNRIQH